MPDIRSSLFTAVSIYLCLSAPRPYPYDDSTYIHLNLCTYTSVYLVNSAFHGFLYEIRIGQEWPGHAYHVCGAAGEHALGHRGHVYSIGGAQGYAYLAFQLLSYPSERTEIQSK